ncbi:MAG: hypothetical protein MUF40_01635 [Gemmatimonadaceae bacterium]|jgi:tetratricopeptide (TPR) repeat protein|nr:hypothetical protein [Gemmatimonadaceae bacterium]
MISTRRLRLLVGMASVLWSGALPAQGPSAAEEADRARAALDAPTALATLERALAAHPSDYGLLWRASREAADLGEATADAGRRTALYARAESWARRAIAAEPRGADGHAMLAIALGRKALSVGIRDRVQYAADVRSAALAALAHDPDHAAALHVLGVWHAEIMRLSGIARFTARTFLGGKVFETASWAEAQRLLERAVAVDPERLTHRLDLATIYRDTKQPARARASCAAVARLPLREYHDARYRTECAALTAALRD